MFREHTAIIRKTIVGGALAASLALSGATALAQDTASPAASPVGDEATVTVDLLSPDGSPVASATLTDTGTGVAITVENSGDSGLTPGLHGIHIHEKGACTPTEGDKPFDDAGGHFNPTDQPHGAPENPEHHGGDLGNLTVNDDGSIDYQGTAAGVTLAEGAMNSLHDADGSALIIHAGEDDLTSQPSGDSGSRAACGVIYGPTGAAPAASPAS